MLLVFRGLQGLGFGGEWATGAILVAEYADPRYRGRVLAFVQSSWAVGWGLAVVVYTVVFNLVGPDLAWRVMFWTGAIPALLVLYVRRNVQDAPAAARARATRVQRVSWLSIWRDGLAGTTFFAALLATGVQGGYYTLATWLPTYLKKDRDLSVVGTGGYLAFLISGAFLGYLTGGLLTDRIGRLGSRSGSRRRRSSAASGPSSPSCTRWRCAAPGRASRTTSGVVSARSSRPPSASSPGRAWASAARWRSARSGTAWRCWPCSGCRRPVVAC
jgi:MFS family permease